MKIQLQNTILKNQIKPWIAFLSESFQVTIKINVDEMWFKTQTHKFTETYYK